MTPPLFPAQERPCVASLRVQLTEAKAERKRLRMAYGRSEALVKRLQAQLRKATWDQRRVPGRPRGRPRKVRDAGTP